MEVCTCSQPHWSATELIAKADVLGAILMRHQSVTGVAITGSVARMEPSVHDLDLVVFHDGSLPTGRFRQKDDESIRRDRDIPEKDIGEKLAHRLEHTRSNVPVTYLFTEETTLWTCRELQLLANKEMRVGFWRTIFCRTPLLLLEYRSEALTQFTEGMERLVRAEYEVVPIKHRCGSLLCRPAMWEETQREIKERKAARERHIHAGVSSSDGWVDNDS